MRVFGFALSLYNESLVVVLTVRMLCNRLNDIYSGYLGIRYIRSVISSSLLFLCPIEVFNFLDNSMIIGGCNENVIVFIP